MKINSARFLFCFFCKMSVVFVFFATIYADVLVAENRQSHQEDVQLFSNSMEKVFGQASANISITTPQKTKKYFPQKVNKKKSKIFFTPLLGLTAKFTIVDLKNKPYTPPFMFSPYFEFYGGAILTYQNIQFSFAPGIFVAKEALYFNVGKSYATQNNAPNNSPKNEKFSFFFNRLDFQYFGNWFSFSLGKNNYVWGEGFSYRFAFPDFPRGAVLFQFPKDDNIWNTHFDWFLKSVSISLGSFFDTQQIDLFKNPQWMNVWAKVSYNNEWLTVLFSLDDLYNMKTKKNTLKSALEAKFVFSKSNHSFSLYNTIANYWLYQNKNPSLKNRFRYLFGAMYFTQSKKINFTLGSELFFQKNFGYIVYTSLSFLEFLQFNVNWFHQNVNANSLELANITTEVAFFKNGFKLSFAYTSINFAQDSIKQGSYFFEMSYKI